MRSRVHSGERRTGVKSYATLMKARRKRTGTGLRLEVVRKLRKRVPHTDDT